MRTLLSKIVCITIQIVGLISLGNRALVFEWFTDRPSCG